MSTDIHVKERCNYLGTFLYRILKLTLLYVLDFVGFLTTYCQQLLKFICHCVHSYALFLKLWIKIDQLDVTYFIISLFNAQHVSNVSTSILRSLRLIVDLFHVLYCSGSMCVGVTVWFGWGGVVSGCRLKHLLYYFTIYCSTCFEC